METFYYVVVSIDGDYANLKRTDIESDDLKLVARALLPAEIMEGSNLKYEFMQYSICQSGGLQEHAGSLQRIQATGTRRQPTAQPGTPRYMYNVN